MLRRAFVALLMSLKMTNAWPLILRVFNATISMICPNCEKMANRDFLSSERERQEIYIFKNLSLKNLTIFLDFLIEVVDVYCVVRPNIHTCKVIL
jgi:hypothetical protein